MSDLDIIRESHEPTHRETVYIPNRTRSGIERIVPPIERCEVCQAIARIGEQLAANGHGGQR